MRVPQSPSGLSTHRQLGSSRRRGGRVRAGPGCPAVRVEVDRERIVGQRGRAGISGPPRLITVLDRARGLKRWPTTSRPDE